MLKTISDFKNLKSHVIGDMIVDTYTDKLIGGYTKTPTASVQEIEKNYIGGAGILLTSKCSRIQSNINHSCGNDLLLKFIKIYLIP